MLRVDRLTYEIKNRKLVKDLSFQVRKGELVAILGANGAGKSTLMKLLSGELKAVGGNIKLNGKCLEAYSGRELAQQRALLSQQQQINLAFTVRELVIMGRYPHFKSVPTRHDLEIVEEAMQICGVHDFEDREYLSLSGGEKQRVQLARVLAQIWDNPNALLLLDEPVSALDMQFQQRVLAIAKAFTKRGFMVITVLHDVNLAAIYADRIIMLKNGRKWADGTPVEVLNKNDIYAIFSVNSTVEIDPATLRPHVKLKEVSLDLESFNSKLPIADHKNNIAPINPLQRQNAYVSFTGCTDEQLDIRNLKQLLSNRENNVTFLKPEIHMLFRQLFRVQYIEAAIQLNACMQKIRLRITSDIEADKLLLDNDAAFLKATSQRIAYAIGLESSLKTAFMFFDTAENYLFEIVLNEQLSDFEQFYLILQEFRNDMQSFSLPRKTPYTDQKYETERPSDKIKFFSKNQDFDTVRKILANHASCHMPLCITLYNGQTQLAYTGTICNLVDQGERYMIHDDCYQLKLQVANIGHIEIVEVSKEQTIPKDINIFDDRGNLFLKLNGLSPDEQAMEMDFLLDRRS